MGLVALVVLGPVAVLLLGAGAAGGWLVMQRNLQRRTRADRDRAIPDLIELFAVAASAGYPVATSVAAVCPRAPSVLVPIVARAMVRLERGLPLADCLDGLGTELGPLGEPLVDALARSAATGAPLGPLVHEVARSARDHRRRAAQEAARRLPVTMLFPLAGCILPAAVLLAVVPVLVVSLASLAV